MLMSVPFLLVTFLVYASFKDLRNLHGKCLMCYLFGLIFLYLSFALIQLNHAELLKVKWMCETTGYIAYVSVLTCFFWLNIMCYDIYSTFRWTNNSAWAWKRKFTTHLLCYSLTSLLCLLLSFQLTEDFKMVFMKTDAALEWKELKEEGFYVTASTLLVFQWWLQVLFIHLITQHSCQTNWKLEWAKNSVGSTTPPSLSSFMSTFRFHLCLSST